ncbi:MAG: nuclear pore complex subunit [Crocinitomicaceae bacterium]|nr:nuclear pore complex subunit [Crocinitomicaceae bacterium]
MNSLEIEGGSKTPTVKLDAEKGTIALSGRCIPENAVDFYKPIYEWLDEYATGPKDNTTVEIRLEYFNTSSSKCLLDVFKKVERLQKDNSSSVKVNWYHETDDEDMLEAGEDYDIIISMPFNMVEVDEI